MLKKQFHKNDVERIRNLVKGKSGDRVTHGVGYTKSTSEDHEEGDEWEEDGKRWVIKDGIRENITKLDKFKSLTVPLFCPGCKQIMNKQLDANYYKSYGECLNCRTEFETKHKLAGTWEEYINSTYNKEIDQLIQEYKDFYHLKLSESNDSYITESGDKENWVGGVDEERAEESLKEVIEYLEGLKK